MKNISNTSTLVEEIRAVSRHVRGDATDVLAQKLRRVLEIEREARIGNRIDASVRAEIERAHDQLQRGILHRLRYTRTEWWY